MLLITASPQRNFGPIWRAKFEIRHSGPPPLRTQREWTLCKDLVSKRGCRPAQLRARPLIILPLAVVDPLPVASRILTPSVGR